LIALVLVLLLNSFLYSPRAAHSFSKETRSEKALLPGQSKTSYYKVLLYEHSIYSYFATMRQKRPDNVEKPTTNVPFCHNNVQKEPTKCLKNVTFF
jgi:hypothetical protein